MPSLDIFVSINPLGGYSIHEIGYLTQDEDLFVTFQLLLDIGSLSFVDGQVILSPSQVSTHGR